jgi:polyisoprenoid-binding protein YceI
MDCWLEALLMTRHFCTFLLAIAAVTACKSSETTIGTAEPAGSTRGPVATPKATDPESVKTLALDASASKFDFDAAKITATHHGSFKRYSGVATLIGGELHSIAVEVETASLEADDPELAQHIKTADFLDVEKFPKATFKSSSILANPGGATHQVTGSLTLHGVTQEVSFPATLGITPTSVRASAELAIDRQKFGVTYPGMPDDLIENEVVLKPTFLFVHQ